MNHDAISPAERTGRGQRPGNAWLRAHILRRCTSVARLLHDQRDSVVVTLIWIGVLVWLALDDLTAWMLGLPAVTF